METFEKEYGKYVVTFKSENEYIEEGLLEENPKFSGILIREKFSTKEVGFYPEEIKFFFGELEKLIPFNKKYDVENKQPLVKFIHKYSRLGYHSDICIAIGTYAGIFCRFFTDVSHQMVFDTFSIISEKSPEFPLETIIQIFKDALLLEG